MNLAGAFPAYSTAKTHVWNRQLMRTSSSWRIDASTHHSP
jgi:hypothetical protein